MARVVHRWSQSVLRLQKTLALSQEDLARALGVSTRNVARWLAGEIENPGEAHFQNLQEIERIVGEADKALARGAVPAWFRAPNPVLGELRPLDLLSSRTGQARVKALLAQIRWGIPT